MGKMQRDKGARFEREIVHKLEFHDIKAKRVPLSGSTWLKGDVIANLNNEDWTLELKKRGNDKVDMLEIAAPDLVPMIEDGKVLPPLKQIVQTIVQYNNYQRLRLPYVKTITIIIHH